MISTLTKKIWVDRDMLTILKNMYKYFWAVILTVEWPVAGRFNGTHVTENHYFSHPWEFLLWLSLPIKACSKPSDDVLHCLAIYPGWSMIEEPLRCKWECKRGCRKLSAQPRPASIYHRVSCTQSGASGFDRIPSAERRILCHWTHHMTWIKLLSKIRLRKSGTTHTSANSEKLYSLQWNLSTMVEAMRLSSSNLVHV